MYYGLVAHVNLSPVDNVLAVYLNPACLDVVAHVNLSPVSSGPLCVSAGLPPPRGLSGVVWPAVSQQHGAGHHPGAAALPGPRQRHQRGEGGDGPGKTGDTTALVNL